ncbi:hypothetical protein DSECCO2_548050 [anaerobic digester metagenome]
MQSPVLRESGLRTPHPRVSTSLSRYDSANRPLVNSSLNNLSILAVLMSLILRCPMNGITYRSMR